MEVGPHRTISFHYRTTPHIMLIKSSHRDVPTSANGRSGTIRIFLIEPNLPDYPEAKFPGCLLFRLLLSAELISIAGVVFSEIYQVTGPVER